MYDQELHCKHGYTIIFGSLDSSNAKVWPNTGQPPQLSATRPHINTCALLEQCYIQNPILPIVNLVNTKNSTLMKQSVVVLVQEGAYIYMLYGFSAT